MTKHGKLFIRYADTVGNGTGNVNATGNYSSTPRAFKLTLSDNQTLQITRLVFDIVDTSGSMATNTYGGLSALNNGITVQIKDGNDNIIHDLTFGRPIKMNGQLVECAHDTYCHAWASSTWEQLKADYNFSTMFANCECILDGHKRHYLEILCNDDLRGLIAHRFLIGGIMHTL